MARGAGVQEGEWRGPAASIELGAPGRAASQGSQTRPRIGSVTRVPRCFRAAVSNLFGTRDPFMEDNFHRWGRGKMVRNNLCTQIYTHIYCTLSIIIISVPLKIIRH